MSIRRQLLNFHAKSIDFRIGVGALDELDRIVRSAVGQPRRALLVCDARSDEAHGETVRRALVDIGFAVETFCADGAPAVASLEAAAEFFFALERFGITGEDLIVALGGTDVCSLASWCARSWCGSVASILIPTEFDAMATCATGMAPLSAGSSARLLSLRPEPVMVICDLALVQALDPSERRCGYPYLLGAILSDSRRKWDSFGQSIPKIVAGEEIALVDALGWTQSARKDVIIASNPSARHALDFGMTCAHALQECLGAEVPWWHLLAEGMRFEARLAVDAANFKVDEMFELDDRFEELGIEELAFSVEPERFIAALHDARFKRANRFMLALPKYPGAIRLASVEDELLERHARAYLASRAELLD